MSYPFHHRHICEKDQVPLRSAERILAVLEKAAMIPYKESIEKGDQGIYAFCGGMLACFVEKPQKDGKAAFFGVQVYRDNDPDWRRDNPSPWLQNDATREEIDQYPIQLDAWFAKKEAAKTIHYFIAIIPYSYQKTCPDIDCGKLGRDKLLKIMKKYQKYGYMLTEPPSWEK